MGACSTASDDPFPILACLHLALCYRCDKGAWSHCMALCNITGTKLGGGGKRLFFDFSQHHLQCFLLLLNCLILKQGVPGMVTLSSYIVVEALGRLHNLHLIRYLLNASLQFITCLRWKSICLWGYSPALRLGTSRRVHSFLVLSDSCSFHV